MTGRKTGAGDLDQRIVIQRPDMVEDEGGGRSQGWTEFAWVWADAWPVGGQERAAAAKIEAATMVRFKIRRLFGLDTTMRVIWQGKAHNIRAIADAGRREPFLTIDAEAGVAQ